MKRILSFVLLICLFASVFGILPVSAQTTDQGLSYEIINEQVTVTGYEGDAKEVVIPAEIEGYPVTAIGDRAFYGCSLITDVTLPDTLTRIGAGAHPCRLRQG